MKRRFDQSDICLITDIENLLFKYANEGSADLSQTLVDFIENDVNVEHLKIQLAMLPNIIKIAFHGTIKTTMADAMIQSDIYQTMLCKVNKLLLLYFTFPVTTTMAERPFSSLRQVKTYPHSTMNACKLNNLLLYYMFINTEMMI